MEYIVYIQIDSDNNVIAIGSSAFLSDTTGWIEIDRGSGVKFYHAQTQYLPDEIMSDNGVYYYQYIDGVVSKKSSEKITSEEDAIKISLLKERTIDYSKAKLADWLNRNPILFNEKYYSVTEEKQSLLNNNLASYERASAAGIAYPLKWNSTGEECVEWEYKDLLSLSLNIAAYVATKVSMQQAYEVQIRNAETINEINGIVINYD